MHFSFLRDWHILFLPGIKSLNTKTAMLSATKLHTHVDPYLLCAPVCPAQESLLVDRSLPGYKEHDTSFIWYYCTDYISKAIPDLDLLWYIQAQKCKHSLKRLVSFWWICVVGWCNAFVNCEDMCLHSFKTHIYIRYSGAAGRLLSVLPVWFPSLI